MGLKTGQDSVEKMKSLAPARKRNPVIQLIAYSLY
jgi:hypothetical protein